MAKKVIRVSVQFDLDKDLTCDDKTIQDEYNGSVKELMEWFVEQEGIWEIINWADSEPILKDAEEIEVE